MNRNQDFVNNYFGLFVSAMLGGLLKVLVILCRLPLHYGVINSFGFGFVHHLSVVQARVDFY
jgi:hypothetical protein